MPASDTRSGSSINIDRQRVGTVEYETSIDGHDSRAETWCDRSRVIRNTRSAQVSVYCDISGNRTGLQVDIAIDDSCSCQYSVIDIDFTINGQRPLHGSCIQVQVVGTRSDIDIAGTFKHITSRKVDAFESCQCSSNSGRSTEYGRIGISQYKRCTTGNIYSSTGVESGAFIAITQSIRTANHRNRGCPIAVELSINGRVAKRKCFAVKVGVLIGIGVEAHQR